MTKDTRDYYEMTKEELIESCQQKDSAIREYVSRANQGVDTMYSKSDIMDLYHNKSDWALRFLKLLFQMGYANKIGKEYFVPKCRHDDFVRTFSGKEVSI